MGKVVLIFRKVVESLCQRWLHDACLDELDERTWMASSSAVGFFIDLKSSEMKARVSQ